MKYLSLISILFLVACGPGFMTQEGAEQKLTQLKTMASQGDAPTAISAGEEALAMMGSDILLSKKIADDGEQDFTFKAFDQSLDIFKIALTKDPSNEKALTYVAILTPLRNLKGMYWRMETMNEWEGDSAVWKYIYLMRSLKTTGLDTAFQVFLIKPFGSRFHNGIEMQKLTKPLTDDLLTSAKMIEILEKNTKFHALLYFPQVMNKSEAYRVRFEDLKALRQYYLFLAAYSRGAGTYSSSSTSFDLRLNTSKEKMIHEFNDPYFGKLVDPEFITQVRDRLLDIISGGEIAMSLLLDRGVKVKNSSIDMFQASIPEYKKCDLAFGCDLTKMKYPAYLTTRTNKRSMFWNEKNQPLNPYANPKRIHQPGTNENSLYYSRMDYPTVKNDMQEFKEMLLGPVVRKIECWSEVEKKHKLFNVMVDFPTYLQNPLQDIRDVSVIAPKHLKQNLLLTDKTVHGLFPRNYPDLCIENL